MAASTVIRYGYSASLYVYEDNDGNPWSKYQYDFIAGQFPDVIPGDGFPRVPSQLAVRQVTFLPLFGLGRYTTWVNSPEAIFDMSKYQFGFNGRIWKPWFYTGELASVSYPQLDVFWRMVASGKYP